MTYFLPPFCSIFELLNNIFCSMMNL